MQFVQQLWWRTFGSTVKFYRRDHYHHWKEMQLYSAVQSSTLVPPPGNKNPARISPTDIITHWYQPLALMHSLKMRSPCCRKGVIWEKFYSPYTKIAKCSSETALSLQLISFPLNFPLILEELIIGAGPPHDHFHIIAYTLLHSQ